MKAALWIVFGLLAALWTGGALLAAELAAWSAALLASGEAVDLGTTVAQWPVPAWVALWVDPAWVQAGQQALAWALELLRDSLPLVGSAVGWLVPVVWVLWGLGLLLMVLLAGGAHLLLGRLVPARPQQA
jgi:hypothetical protein